MARHRVSQGLRRWGVFNLVGLAGFVVQISMLAWFTRVWGWHFVTATVVAMQAVIVQNYFAHSRWTWGDRPAPKMRERLWRPLRYQVAKTTSLALNVALTTFFVARAGLPPEAANLLAVLLCAVVNYKAADRLVFREAGSPIQSGSPAP